MSNQSSLPARLPSKKEAGTITLKLSAEDTKRFIVSGYPNSKEMKIKLPFRLKLTNDSTDPHNPAKFSAKLVLKTEEKAQIQESLPKIEKIEGKESNESKQPQLQTLPLPQLPELDHQASQMSQPNSLIPLDEDGDGDIFPQIFKEESPSDSPFQFYSKATPWKSVHQFFQAIIAEINAHSVYGVLLDQHLLVKMLQSKNQSFLNTQQTQQLLSIALGYMALAKNQAAHSDIPTHLQLKNFAETMGSEWHRLQGEIFTSNKNILKILDYIQPKDENEGSRYTHCYFDLKFDLSQEEVSKVAEAVKYQCRYNHKAFCFLTNYLFKSCRKLQERNACIKEIEDSLVIVLSKLVKDHPSSSSLEGDESLLFHHTSFQVDRAEYPYKYLNLKNIPKDKKIETLEAFIHLRAKDAQKSSIAFSKLIKDTCSKEGSNLTTGVKIKSMRKRKAIDRVKEKILDKISSKHRAEIMLSVNPNLNIDQYTEQEFEQYKERLNSIFTSLEENIEFGVDDLLRGRCIFSSLDKLNNCCSQVKREVEKRGFKLLALLNRLKEQTCDIILHIQIGKTIAQLQLVINYKIVQNQFNYKLNYLKKTQFYNHLTHLKLYNDKMTYLFLEEAFKFLDVNQRSDKPIDYKEKTDFARSADNLNHFISTLPFELNKQEIDISENEVSLLAHELQHFDAIKSQQVSSHIDPSFQINKHNGDYSFELHDYDDAQHFLSAYCKQVQAKHQELITKTHSSHYFDDEQKSILKDYAGAINTLGKIYMHRKQFHQSTDKFEQSERLIKIVGNRDQHIAETLKNLGQIQYKRGNLTKSIDIYQNLLALQEKAKHSEQYVQTLMSLALVYKHQGNYFEAEKHFKKCLEILQKQKGKEHILLASVYNHLGATYNLQGILPQSLINYKSSLEIIEKEKGKNSFDCASVLGNIALIYENDANYYEAISYYEKSALICTKHNVKEAIYANSIYGLGKCYSSLKNYSKAIEYYKKALEFFQKDISQMYYTTLTDIAVAYENLGEVEQANHYYDLLQSHEK